MIADQQADSQPTASGGTPRWRWKLRAYLRAALPFALGIAATVLGVVLYGVATPDPEPLSMAQIEEGVTAMLAEATPAPAYSAQVYERIFPSLVVVRINDFGPDLEDAPQFTQASLSQTAGGIGFGGAELRLTGLVGGRDLEAQAQEPVFVGSGVIVSADGAILTAYHVVERASRIDITYADGTEAAAAIVAVQPDNNIAVLQADALPELWAPATLGNPGALRIGDEAYVVGNPLGLAGSLSAGVISGLERTYTRSDGEPPLEGLIQFDSAVNPGSAGGPLLNRNGEVVGIVVGPANPTEQETFIGIGFAVRIDVAGGAAGAPEL